MEDRHGAGFDRRELESEQLPGDEKHRLAQPVELQVRLDLVRVQVVLRPPDFFRIVAVVPGLDGDPRAFLVGDRLHVGDLLAHAGHGGGPNGLHQLQGLRRRLGHAILEAPACVVGETEQPDALVPQLQDLGDHGVVVVLVAVVAAVDEHPPDLLALRAFVGVREERLDGRPGVGDRVLAFVLALDRGRSGGLHERLGQPAQLLSGEVDGVALLVGEHVVREAGVQLGELLLDRRVALGGRALERRAVAGEVVVDHLHEPFLIRPQRVGAALVDRSDTSEERAVLRDLRAELGELRGHLLLDLAELRGGEVPLPDAPVLHDPFEVPAGALERHDRVLEGGRLGVGDDVCRSSASCRSMPVSSAGLSAARSILSRRPARRRTDRPTRPERVGPGDAAAAASSTGSAPASGAPVAPASTATSAAASATGAAPVSGGPALGAARERHHGDHGHQADSVRQDVPTIFGSSPRSHIANPGVGVNVCPAAGSRRGRWATRGSWLPSRGRPRSGRRRRRRRGCP